MGTEMEEIDVLIIKGKNYGAYAPKYPGVVATHATYEGVKKAFDMFFGLHLVGMAVDGDRDFKEYKLVYREIP